MDARPFLLLVDDTPEIALIVRRFGKYGGQEVACCADVATAWDYLGRMRPALLILDLNLPGESGLVLCRRLRATPALADLPIALFSHWERPEDIAAGLEAGADFVLSKDLLGHPDAWQERVRELLAPPDGRPGRQSLSWHVVPLAGVARRNWVEATNQVLHSWLPGVLPWEVLGALLRRAASRAGPDFPPDGLAPDGLALVSGLAARPDLAVRFAAALAEQLWCVLGTAASAPLRAALYRAVTPPSELPAP